jgi:gas vesicle protein
MSKERKSGFGKFLLGAGIGVGLGILFAPKSGKETRQELKEKMDDLVEKAKNIQVEDVKATIEAKVQEIKEDLKNLDKETVAAAVKSGAAKIKRKADELVEFAVLKGTPVIEAAAREVKNSTIKTLEGITAKLKDEEPKKQETKPQNKKKSQTSK